jgi:hypothetical protein
MERELQYYNRYGTHISIHIAKKLCTLYYSNGKVILFQNLFEEFTTSNVPNVKRNISLSSTINSPSHNDIKLKLFTVWFAALLIDNDPNDDVFPASCDNSPSGAIYNIISKKPHVSTPITLLLPIQVKNVNDITLFKNSLSSIIDIKKISFKATQSYLSLHPKD